MQIPLRQMSVGAAPATLPAQAAAANGDGLVSIERPPVLGVPYAAVSEALEARIGEHVRGSVRHKNEARRLTLTARCLL